MAMLMTKLSRQGGPLVLALRWGQAVLQATAAILLSAPATAADPQACDIVLDPQARTNYLFSCDVNHFLNMSAAGCSAAFPNGKVEHACQYPDDYPPYVPVMVGDPPRQKETLCYVCYQQTQCQYWNGINWVNCDVGKKQMRDLKALWWVSQQDYDHCWLPKFGSDCGPRDLCCCVPS